MKSKQILPELNLTTFYSFMKLDIGEQKKMIKKEGIFLDRDIEDEKAINLYFLRGFFVEETVLTREQRVLEIIAFKQGYKIERFLEVKEVLAAKNSY
jgi:hypothetical protein